MEDDYYGDAASPSEAEGKSVAHEETKEDRTPENKLALVQSSFFKGPVKPGDREMVEIVEVYENEVSVKCVYGDDDDDDDSDTDDASEMGMSDASAPAEAEDAMMS